jgi:hypothetical protein
MIKEAGEESFAAFLGSKQSARDLFRRYQKPIIFNFARLQGIAGDAFDSRLENQCSCH